MKKLFEVHLKYYALAEDEHEALSMRIDKAACTHGVIEAHTVDADWWNALPWGDDDNDRTCGEIAAAAGLEAKY